MPHKFLSRYFLAVCMYLVANLSLCSWAKVTDVRIISRDTILEGRSWGSAGAYELIKGQIFFQTDPYNFQNQIITDIEYAPTNSMGLVESMSDLVILKPIDPMKITAGLVEISNRGGKFTPSYFLAGRGRLEDPDDALAFGDGLLLELGVAMVWIGWQFDVPEGPNTLNFFPPTAQYPEGTPITGLVRSDWVVDEITYNLKLGHRAQNGYPVYDPTSDLHRLTRRKGRDSMRIEVDRNDWQFARLQNGIITPAKDWIYASNGFVAGYIYELVYYAQNPPVVGLGLAAIRDVAAFMKEDTACFFRAPDIIAAGVSQTGRLLRHFLHQGFNVTETGERAYDGMMIITAGAGRGSFNHRFAQPSRDAHRYSAFLYPTDIFPFSSRSQFDPILQREDGLGINVTAEHFPKIFYVNTGYEYYGRAASLLHTTIDGKSDLLPRDDERIFHIASGQHFVDQFPPQDSIFPVVGNPLQFKPNYRALLVALKEWVNGEASPPDSKYPTLQSGNLVEVTQLKYPQIPGLKKTSVVHQAMRVDYGPQWKNGIITHQPPIVHGSFPSLVPQVDLYGNEVGGIRNFEITVPLATYIPYSLRGNKKSQRDELTDFRGTYIPLPQETDTDDDRPTISSLYPSKENYLTRVRINLDSLKNERFILSNDIHHLMQRASDYWNHLISEEILHDRGIGIMTFNIRYDNPGDGISSWEFRKDHVLQIIEKYQPEFLGLQESLLHQCKDVQRGLKGYRWIGVGREDGKQKGEYAPIFYQNKIWKVIKSGHFWLSPSPEKPSKGWDASYERIVTWASFRHRKNGNTIVVFNTHFDHRGVQARQESISLLLERIPEISQGHPYVLMGDFNFAAHSAPYLIATNTATGILMDGKHLSMSSPKGPSGTFSGFTVKKNLPIHQIDHIFLKPSFDVVDFEVIADAKEGFYPSDHFPVYLKIFDGY